MIGLIMEKYINTTIDIGDLCYDPIPGFVDFVLDAKGPGTGDVGSWSRG